MRAHQTYAVFGLGQYGTAVATELVSNGAEVLVVDNDEAVINAAASTFPVCKCADVTDREVFHQLDIANINVVIIAMANNLEASVLATMLCKEAGVETVIVKCSDEMHCKILSRVGADRVVIPESESGIRLAKKLLSPDFSDIIDLSTDVSVVEMDVRPEWVGKNLLELNLRKRYSINIIAIRQNDMVSIEIDPSRPFTTDMQLIVIAHTEKLAKLK